MAPLTEGDSHLDNRAMAPRNPYPTVDVVVETAAGVVFIERKHEPIGWALPGGFVDYGEPVEDAARREVMEETGLDVQLVSLLGVYSHPDRDPRQHNLSVVYVGRAEGVPRGADDAAQAQVFPLGNLPPLVFDHTQIIADYRRFLASGRCPRPAGPDRALTAAERVDLLRVAREALLVAAGGPATPWTAFSGRLAVPGACFVTLKTAAGELRGCMGVLDAKQALGEAVARMTQASALHDPRFSAVAADEAAGLQISLSVLGAPRRATPDEVVVGVHGLVIERGPHRGVLLPQVAVEQGWDAPTFLAQTCLKANLPQDAWRAPDTELSVFDAQVFGC